MVEFNNQNFNNINNQDLHNINNQNLHNINNQNLNNINNQNFNNNFYYSIVLRYVIMYFVNYTIDIENINDMINTLFILTYNVNNLNDLY